ncbi:UPF0481 protein At3g47200-like [Corylus avellana]|uniref:UPF0481 protein At3g47200-like n=1 Tax=Corylus avellana TaxID=13451 RepID=UPI001E203F70|nr:UPF0481 protein At3g47200-like [Corylus avellana]
METGEGGASHGIDINPRDNDERLIAKMKGEIFKSNPSLPRETVTSEKRCIYRPPERFKNINGKWLEPQVVAIGPYHRLNPKLQMMEGVKWRSLGYFVRNKEGDYLGKCLKQIRPLEGQLRACYSSSETINLSTDEFLQMMVVDGCFILDLFLNFEKEVILNFEKGETSDHPLCWLKSQKRVIVSKIYADLLLLENQIPSIVLKELYGICSKPGDESLSNIATEVFKKSMLEIDPFDRKRPPLEWLHLLDLVRSLFIPRAHNEKLCRWMFALFSPTPCVTKLRRAGIKIKRDMPDSFLEVKFKGGVIEMPVIALDHQMCSLLVNCVAFEQCHNCSTHFSIYATFLDGFVNTDKDIEYLSDRRIIANSFGTDAEAAGFINNLGQDLTIYNEYDNNTSYLIEFFLDVNRYYYRKRMHWNKWQWTSFKREYFGKPWMLISAFVAFVLLALTFLQTFYTIYAYHLHPKN